MTSRGEEVIVVATQNSSKNLLYVQYIFTAHRPWLSYIQFCIALLDVEIFSSNLEVP